MSRLSRRAFVARAAAMGGALAVGVLPEQVAAAAGELPQTLIDELRPQLRGPIYRRGTASYLTATPLYNERFDGIAPGAVIRPLDAGDVQKTLLWAARYGIAVVPRGGGHSYSGNSTVGLPGVMLDLRYLRAVLPSSDRTTARIGGGALAIDVIAQLANAGVAVPTGSCPSVGVTGLALGGGIGLTSRQHGLTCDRIEELTIVTADGTVRTASSDNEPELFWASRGAGGGNLGIVTSMVLRTAPLTPETTVRVQYPWSSAAKVLEAYFALAPDAPRELTADLAISKTWDARDPLVTVDALYLGEVAAARAVLAPLLAIPGAAPVIQASTRLQSALTFAECSQLSTQQCRPARFGGGGTLQRSRFYAASAVLASTPGTDVQSLLLQLGAGARPWPTGRRIILVASLGGAVDDVAAGATAYPHRGARHLVQVLTRTGGVWEDADARRWTGATRAAIATATASTGAYVNYLDPDQPDWAQAYYGASLPRLQAVKRAHDPLGRFAPRQGIPLGAT